MSGATVLVTGASFGIGEATACKLAAAGATVLLAARSGDKLDDLVRTITASGGHAVSYPADLSDEATAPRWRNESSTSTGRRTSW